VTADRPADNQPSDHEPAAARNPADEPPDGRPVLRIVAGNPTDVELAAVTAVLLARAASDAGAGRPRRPTGWSDLSLRLRQPLPAGPDAWRNSRWQ
jgi:hypothetical protein